MAWCVWILTPSQHYSREKLFFRVIDGQRKSRRPYQRIGRPATTTSAEPHTATGDTVQAHRERDPGGQRNQPYLPSWRPGTDHHHQKQQAARCSRYGKRLHCHSYKGDRFANLRPYRQRLPHVASKNERYTATIGAFLESPPFLIGPIASRRKTQQHPSGYASTLYNRVKEKKN